MAEDLALWIERLKRVKTRRDLFSALDQFRVLEWSNEQRSQIAKLYMRLIDVLPEGEEWVPVRQDEVVTPKPAAEAVPVAAVPAAAPAVSAVAVAEEDEEVWYEKM
jgi:hypothetical protein